MGCPAGDDGGPNKLVGENCSTTSECTRNPLSECVSGTCQLVEPTVASACSVQTDCGERERCSNGLCAFFPSCQQIDGEFVYQATCVNTDRTGTVTARTEDCLVSFSGAVGTTPFRIGFATVPAVRVLEDEVVLTDCTGGGAWSAAESAAVLRECDLANDTCDVVLVPVASGLIPCFNDDDCDAGSCESLSILQQGTGTCR